MVYILDSPIKSGNDKKYVIPAVLKRESSLFVGFPGSLPEFIPYIDTGRE